MFEVIMPKMGESITEGTILEWKKKVGDKIDKDETLLEISTDKVDSEIPSPSSGILVEILAQVNDIVPVGEIIAKIGANGETKEKIKIDEQIELDKAEELTSKSLINKEAEISIDTPLSIKFEGRFYSPLVKSIALKECVSQNELDSISGSGRGGRVNKSDIIDYIDNRKSNTDNITQIDFKQKEGLDSISSYAEDSNPIYMSDKIEPMSRMRRRISDHMLDSLKTSAHVYTVVEADVTNLVNIRKNNKESFQAKSGVNLTYTPMLLDACIKAIQDFPLMNTSIKENNIVHHRNINMGVAVALPDDNLIVPVIHSSEEKNFLGLARSVSDLAKRSRENCLYPEEIFGSTFTITNPGVFGGLFGMGIINQPNVGILSIGSFQKRPVVKETEYGDTIVVRSMVYLTLSYDHRIIDGAYGTKFLARLVEIIENYNNDHIQN